MVASRKRDLEDQPQPVYIPYQIKYIYSIPLYGSASGSEGKASAYNAGDRGLIPGSGRSPGEGKWPHTPVLLPGESVQSGNS